MQNEELQNQDYNAPLIRELGEQQLAQSVASPNNPPWGSWMALAVWAFSVFLILFLPQIFVLPLLLSRNLNLTDSSQMIEFLKTDPTAILLQVASTLPAHILTLAAAWLAVTKNRKYPFRQMLGWEWNGFKIWHAIVFLIIFYAAAFGLTTLFGEQDNEFMRMLRSSRATVYVVAFMATFTAPLVEEVVYRGILYSAFQRTFGVILAIVFVTAIFALIHFPQYMGSPATLIMITLLSLSLTLVRVKTGSLLPCIILHTAINGSQSLMLLLQPYLEDAAKQLPEQAAAIFQFLK